MRIITLSLLLSIVTKGIAGYTTPNTGVQWNLDSLVARSSGTLTGAFPNYTMTDTITIATTDRLTIPAGSIITVTQGAGKGFTVFGVLRAIGTARDSIIVKGSVDSSGWHRGFRFDDTSIDSLCVVSYCRIMNAVDAVYCFNANTTITNSLFTRNSTNGVRCFGASPTIRNCSFIENRQSCITANSSSSPLIENNIFARNNSRNTGPNNAIAIGGQGANNPTIRGNEIYNQNYFRAGAIGLSTLGSADVCSPLIENNYLHDNSFGVATTAFSAGGVIQPMIRYNRIENNRINPDPQVSGSGITMQAGGPSNAPIITGNIIKGNYWGITCVSSTGLTNSPQPKLGNLSNADTSDDGWNIFDNNNNGGVIYQLYNNGTQDISAQNNYWGSADSTTVEQWIVHRPDSSVFGKVNYSPWGRKGLGSPDSFSIQPIGSQLRLRWRFPSHTSPATLRLLYGRDSLTWEVVATMADTQTTYLFTILGNWRHYFGLTSFNRFGNGDTTVRWFNAFTPSVKELSGVPTEFSLAQNYPNPFNPSTAIEFQIPHSSFVILKMFDALGREVKTLVSEQLNVGKYEVTLDARELASGVYYYRLTAGNFSAVKKLVLMK